MTSALVAAGTLAMADGAMAQGAAPTVKLGVGGYLEEIVGVAFQRPPGYKVGANAGVPLAAAVPLNTFDQQTESEIHIEGRGRLDNGLNIVAHFELEVSGSPGAVWDEAYLILRNGFGQVILGAEDPVSELMTAGYGNGLVAHAGQNLAFDAQTFIPVPANFTASPTISAARAAFIEAPDNNDSNKIIYVSPRFAGLQGGVSYSPEYRNQLWDGNGAVGVGTGGGSADANRRLPVKDLLHDMWSAAINYEFTAGDFKVGLATGYTMAMKPTMHNTIPGHTSNVKEWGAGGRVDMGGWRFLAGYKTIHNTDGTSLPLYAPAGVASTMFSTLAPGTSDDGWGVNVGTMYSWGPNAVSLNGRWGTERGCYVFVTATAACSATFGAGVAPATLTFTNSHQRVRGTMLSYARTLAPGVKWTANWQYAAYDDQGERDMDMHGNAVTTTFKLDF